MNDPRDFDEAPENAPTPLWKRRSVLILGGAVIVVLVFIFTRHGTPTPTVAASQDTSISVTSPYEGPPPIKAVAPATLPAAPTPQPPAILAKPAPTTAGTRPAAISYPVHIERPPIPTAAAPAELDQTKLKFATSTIAGIKASPAIDDTYMLMPGLLPCELDSAIDSNLPGPFFCHLPGPVYSTKGIKLMDAMTQVVGNYESLKQNGVERLKAMTATAHVPVGQAGQVWVNLAGQPFGDELGRSGLSGTIDHRYFERFGGAVLLDLSKSALQYFQAEVSKGGNTYLNLDSGNQLASQILESTINLPPLFYKNQGSMIAIVLTEPVDFSDSYKAVAKR